MYVHHKKGGKKKMYIARKPETQKRKETQQILPQETRAKVLKTKPLNEIKSRDLTPSTVQTEVTPAKPVKNQINEIKSQDLTPPTVQTEITPAKPVKNQNLPSHYSKPRRIEELRRSEESALQHQGMKKEACQRAKERYERFANSMTNVDNIDFMERKPGDAERLEKEAKRLWDEWKRLEKEAEKADRELQSIQARIRELEKNPKRAAYYAMGSAERSAGIAARKGEKERWQQYGAELNKAYNELVNAPAGGAQMGAWTQEKEAAAQALLVEMQENNSRYNAVCDDLRVLEDVDNEQKEATIISEMDPTDFLLVELTGMSVDERIRHLNRATPEVRAALRTKGETDFAVTDPKKALKNRGYSNDEIKAICDTYERITNETNMYEMQVQAARKAEDNPISTTLSTYPAKLLGDVSSDITALTSNIASDWGLSTYSTMDVNLPGFWASEYVDTTRDTVSSKLNGAAKVAYQVGNDTVDGLLKDEVGELVGMPWLAVTGAYGEKARKAIIYGGTSEQSNLLGTAKLTEAAVKNAVNNLTNQPETWYGKVFQAGMQATIDQTFKQARQIALNNHPEYVRRVEELMRSGMDLSRAREQALYQMMLERNG